ncbi:MAG: hypothetical protein KAT88_10965 [Spirochaetes bacterium]|nr:hypothetical protein [Spirochaetota bacterium]
MRENSGDIDIDVSVTRRNKGTGRSILSLAFFILSIFFVFSIINYIHPFTELLNRIPFFNMNHSLSDAENYITSYLSRPYREMVQRDALLLLKRKRYALQGLENELGRLDRTKGLFTDSMEEKSAMFEENISIIDGKEAKRNLKSAVYLIRTKKQFRKEVQSRKDTYQDLYSTKKERLLEKKERYKVEIADLTMFIRNIENGDRAEGPVNENVFFIAEAKRDIIERVLFLIDSLEYEDAIDVLGNLLAMEFAENEAVHESLLIRLLSVLEEYNNRVEFLQEESLFEEIKMDYLSEDYSEVLSKLDTLEAGGYVRPLLTDLRSALNENIIVAGEITDEVELKDSLAKLIKKAASFEEAEDFNKALGIYEDLLILNLPSYDREYLVQKIHSILVPSIKNEIKRGENTKAIKYLEKARNFYLGGEEEEAFRYYRLIVTDCPNSDYVEDALNELIRIYKN